MRRGRLRYGREECVRAGNVQLSHDCQLAARIQSILVEDGREFRVFVWDRRARAWRDKKDARKENAPDLLELELRSSLVNFLVDGYVVPPPFRWEETTQMFTCIDEVTWQTASISEDVVRELIRDHSSSVSINWKQALE